MSSDHGPSTGPDSTGGIHAGSSTTAGSRLRRQTHTDIQRSSPVDLQALKISLPEAAHG